MGVPNTQEVRSVSKFGLSMVTVVFDDAVPIYLARQLVTERIADVRGRIPDGLQPVLGPVATAFGEIYQYVVTGEGIDAMAAKTAHDWEVRTRLRSVPGVSEVNTWGGQSKQFQVVVDPRRLDQYGLALGDVLRAVADNNQSFSGGFIEHQAERYTVRGVGLLADVPRHRAGRAGLAPRRAGAAPRRRRRSRWRRRCRNGAVTRNGQGEVVGGMVIMLKGENARDLSGRVKTRLAEIAATLPPGMRLEKFYDQTEVIDRTTATVTKNLLEGSVLVVVGAVRLPARRARLADRRRGHPAVDAGRLHRHARLRRLGQPDVARRHRLRPDRRRRGGDDGELRAPPRRHRRAARPRARARTRGHPPRPLPQRRRRSGAAGAVRRAHHHRRLPADLHARRTRGQDVPADGDHRLHGAVRLAAAVADRGAGGVVVPAAARRPSRRRGVVRAAARLLPDAAGGAHAPSAARPSAWPLVIVVDRLGSVPFLGTEFMPRLDEGSILIETRKLPSVSLEESVAISTRVEQIVLERFPEVVADRDQARPAGSGHRGDGHLPGRRLRAAAPRGPTGPAAAPRPSSSTRWPKRCRTCPASK